MYETEHMDAKKCLYHQYVMTVYTQYASTMTSALPFVVSKLFK